MPVQSTPAQSATGVTRLVSAWRISTRPLSTARCARRCGAHGWTLLQAPCRRSSSARSRSGVTAPRRRRSCRQRSQMPPWSRSSCSAAGTGRSCWRAAATDGAAQRRSSTAASSPGPGSRAAGPVTCGCSRSGRGGRGRSPRPPTFGTSPASIGRWPAIASPLPSAHASTGPPPDAGGRARWRVENSSKAGAAISSTPGKIGHDGSAIRG